MSGQWWRKAKCASMPLQMFYPVHDNQSAYLPARNVCNQCPVVSECLNDALDRKEHDGMWGGMTPRERRAFVKDGTMPDQFTEAHGDKAGTVAGYYRERRAKVPFCDQCREAFNAHMLDMKIQRSRKRADDFPAANTA